MYSTVSFGIEGCAGCEAAERRAREERLWIECADCGAVFEGGHPVLVRTPRERRPVKFGSRAFKELERRTVIDCTSIAAYRAVGTAPSSWVVPAPRGSIEADEFAGKIGTRPARVPTEIDREMARDHGRALNARYEALRGGESARALVWLVELGGAALASAKPILEAIGWGLATEKQRRAWRAAGDVIGMSAEMGRRAWGPGVAVWCNIEVQGA